MAKKKNKVTHDFYDFTPIDSTGCATRVVIGERSNGKTYGVKIKIFEGIYHDPNFRFIYLRRRRAHIVRTKMERLFSDINDSKQNILGKPILYNSYKSKFYVQNEDDSINEVGSPLAIEEVFLDKGVPQGRVDLILFDEFLDLEYMEDELVRYVNVISTVTRNNPNCIIYVLGNTINKRCPYFKLFGFDINKIKHGMLAQVNHKKGATVALHYAPTFLQDVQHKSEKKNKFIGFDEDESVNMIMYGEWETISLPTKSIDDVTWNNPEFKLLPLVVTGMKKTYQIVLKTSNIPVCGVREINTQNGMVGKYVRYNISADGDIVRNKNGIVPIFRKFSETLIDKTTSAQFKLAVECINAGRCLFISNLEGTEFLGILSKII